MKKKGYDSKQNIKRKSMHKNIKNNLKFFTIFEKGTVMRTTFPLMKIIQCLDKYSGKERKHYHSQTYSMRNTKLLKTFQGKAVSEYFRSNSCPIFLRRRN